MVRPGENAQIAIPGAIGKQRRRQKPQLPRLDIAHPDPADPGSLHIHADRLAGAEQGDARLIRQNLFLLPFLIVFRGLGAGRHIVGEFLQQIAQVGIGIPSDPSAQTDPDLRTVVAAQDGTVVDQRHFQAQPGRRHGGADPGDPASDDDQVIPALETDLAISPDMLFPETGQRLHPVREGLRIQLPVAEHDGITTAVQAGQILQGQPDHSPRGRGRKRPAALPHPAGTGRTAADAERAAIDENGECAGALFPAPGRGPVVRTDIYVPGPGVRKRHRRLSVTDRSSQPVCQQVGRSDRRRELLVGHPAAGLGERFRLETDQMPPPPFPAQARAIQGQADSRRQHYLRPGRNGNRQEGENKKDKYPFHISLFPDAMAAGKDRPWVTG